MSNIICIGYVKVDSIDLHGISRGIMFKMYERSCPQCSNSDIELLCTLIDHFGSFEKLLIIELLCRISSEKLYRCRRRKPLVIVCNENHLGGPLTCAQPDS